MQEQSSTMAGVGEQQQQGVVMPRVKLGTQGLEVIFNSKSIVLQNKVKLSNFVKMLIKKKVAISIIKHAFHSGITFFDTSDIYGVNTNKVLVGKALQQLPREMVQLATKFGVVKLHSNGVIIKGNPEYVRSCCEASLNRLGVEYIDLYYPHRIDTTVPIEDTMGELKKLVEEGKIKYIGLVEASPETIRRAHAVHPITALQMDWSLWTRDIEEEIVPLCRELGIGMVPYSPLGRGLFGVRAVVERIPAYSFLMHPRFQGENFEKNEIFYSCIEKLAEKHGCTPAQLALAWVLHQVKEVQRILIMNHTPREGQGDQEEMQQPPHLDAGCSPLASL
ncbi:hypothetical protein SLEP1_g36516 [Rubroshorea leprosula]|uniref:NADP-dependent oxidoreductase domain-containing protein n=1 Tax=Rubroshorea leprosula TaxID=152421 RepID=A0AAV5KRW7_9ROSI|nr:hypothetical protein SLEP1_g36516 [Rubroshorea leprosula]